MIRDDKLRFAAKYGKTLLRGIVITGHNEVEAKVIFLHLSVILFTGGRGSASVHAGMLPPPPGADTPRADTPQSRHPLGAETPQEQTPPPEQTPPGKQTPAYGL